MASYPDQPKKSSRTKQARGPQVARDAQNSVTPESTSADRSRKARPEAAAAQDENTIRARRARIQSQSTDDLDLKSPMDRRGASVPWQKGRVDVDHAETGESQQRLRDQSSVRGHHREIGAERSELIEKFWALELLGLQDRQSG